MMKNLLDHPALRVKDITPGKVVRAFRRNFGFSIAKISRLTNIPASNLSAIENERLDIGVRRSVLLAAVFGIGPEQILFPEGYERPENKETPKPALKLR